MAKLHTVRRLRAVPAVTDISAPEVPTAAMMLRQLSDRLVTLESQLRVMAGASKAISNEVWTPLQLDHLTAALHLLGNDVGRLQEDVDHVLCAEARGVANA